MTIFDYLLPLNFLYNHLSKKLPPSLWIMFQFIDGETCLKIQRTER